MLVTFSSEAYADITMLGDVALALLKMMGHSATVPGAILAPDVGAALSQLRRAINAAEATGTADSQNVDEPAVSMANRAWPLIQLLAAAQKENVNVMWK